MSGSGPSIRVVEPGLFSTVQDLGRLGYGPMGVSASGAADPIALRIGNLLVGNPEGAAAIEMTLAGGTFEFPSGGTIALTGSDFDAGLPLWKACEINPGAVLRCGASVSGARCYLAVRGGLEVDLFLGSASTHVLSGLGGKVLRRGDVLQIGDRAADPIRTVHLPALRRMTPRKILRATDGPQAGWFKQNFFQGEFEVTEEANRMGLRLQGALFEMDHAGKMLSEGVSLGAIQIAAGGQPIIMFVEQQTTGGYPKIANVILADMSSVGQLRPRERIKFERVSIDEARDIWRRQEGLLTGGGLFA
jgi:antagonist of KipI